MRFMPQRVRFRPRAVGTGLVAAVVIAFIAGGLARLQINTGVSSFTPREDPATHAMQKVSSSFGGDPIVVLTESKAKGQALSSGQLPRLLQLEGQLSRLPDVASVYGPATVLNQISGQAHDLLAELSGYRDALQSKAAADARARGASPNEVRDAGARATAGFDSRYGSLIVQGLPAGLPTLHNERFVHQVVFDKAGEPRPQWHFVVPSADSVSILVRPRPNLSQEATERLTANVQQSVRNAGLDSRRVTVSGVPAIVSALGTEVRHEVPYLGGVAVFAVGAWFLLMRWTAWRRRLLPLVTTATATGLLLAAFGWCAHPISLGAVALLPILLGVGSDFMTYLQRRIQRRVVLTVALATAASFAGLAATPLPVVQELGLTLAAGILVAVAVAFLLTWRFPPAPDHNVAWGPKAHSAVAPRPQSRRAARPKRITAGALVGVLAVGGWLVVPSLPLNGDFQSFAADLPALQDARHVENIIGSSGEIDVSLSGSNVVSKDAVDWMRRKQDAIVTAHGDQIRPTLTPATLLRFLGPSPTDEQLDAALRLLPSYLTNSVIRDDRHMAVMSFGVKLTSIQQMQGLRDDVTKILGRPPAGIRADVTGLPVLGVSASQAVSRDRYLANVLGTVAAGAVLALGLRRRGDALRAIVAAATATGLGLLGMWLLGIALTPITVAVGSLTAAVGCEFTVVLAEAARHGDGGMRRAAALAAGASATGYSVLTLSGLGIVRQFGALLSITVVLAFISAWFVVWAWPDSTANPESAEVSSQSADDDLTEQSYAQRTV